MKAIRVIVCFVGIVCVLPSCKTQSSFVSLKKNRAAAFPQKEGEIKADERAVVGLVSAQDQPASTVGLTMGDVMESNAGATVLASAGITENRTVRTTAYCHKEADSLPYGLKSADGTDLKFGMIRSAAADWSRFPVGTRFKIKGMPYEYVVDDYGSALVGTDTIDLYKPTFAAMNQWGAREVPIEIIEWGCFDRSRKILAGRLHKTEARHVKEMHSAIANSRPSKRVKRMPIQEPLPGIVPAVSTLDSELNIESASNDLPRVVINGGEDSA